MYKYVTIHTFYDGCYVHEDKICHFLFTLSILFLNWRKFPLLLPIFNINKPLLTRFTKIYKYLNNRRCSYSISFIKGLTALWNYHVLHVISRHLFCMLFMALQGIGGPGQWFLHQHTACFYFFGIPKDSSFDLLCKSLWFWQITAKKERKNLSWNLVINLFTLDTTLDIVNLKISIINFLLHYLFTYNLN